MLCACRQQAMDLDNRQRFQLQRIDDRAYARMRLYDGLHGIGRSDEHEVQSVRHAPDTLADPRLAHSATNTARACRIGRRITHSATAMLITQPSPIITARGPSPGAVSTSTNHGR